MEKGESPDMRACGEGTHKNVKWWVMHAKWPVQVLMQDQYDGYAASLKTLAIRIVQRRGFIHLAQQVARRTRDNVPHVPPPWQDFPSQLPFSRPASTQTHCKLPQVASRDTVGALALCLAAQAVRTSIMNTRP